MKTKEMVVCAMFAALMAIGANVSPFLMIGGVPVTLQLMFAILAGGLLGSRLGALSMVTYMLLGLMGAPIFAQLKGGPAQLLSPTFGFILSFIAVAYITGKIVGDRVQVTKKAYVAAAVLSLFFNYVIGTNWMFAAFRFWADAPEGFSYFVAWGWMGAYLPLDVVVIIVSFAVIPRLKLALKVRMRAERSV